VVISTFNRPARLAALLQALGDQTAGPRRFEVIVVDNGSQGTETGAVISTERARGRLALRTLRHERTRGPSGGRNSGWRLARAPLVAFTDDDCRPTAEWLAEALTVARRHPGAVVQGPTAPDPRELTAASAGRAESLRAHTVRVDRLGPQYETCNIFYPRPLLAELGGFDESFGTRPAGEDTDLAWRAIERGVGTVFAPGALVYHAVERLGHLQALRLATRWSEGVRLYARHPAARTMLYRGVFWNVWHYLLWRSIAALAAPAPLRRLLLTRHLLELRRRAGAEPAGAAAVPLLLLHDLVECGAITWGAIRHRTLVL